MFFQFALKAKCINPISDQEKNNPRDEFVGVSGNEYFCASVQRFMLWIGELARCRTEGLPKRSGAREVPCSSAGMR